MVIRAHGHFPAIHAIGAVVCTHIAQDVQVKPAHAFADHPLAFAVAETRAVGLDEEILPLETRSRAHIGHGLFRMGAPFEQPLVHFFAQLFRAVHGNEPQRAHRVGQKGVRIPSVHKISHAINLFRLDFPKRIIAHFVGFEKLFPKNYEGLFLSASSGLLLSKTHMQHLLSPTP